MDVRDCLLYTSFDYCRQYLEKYDEIKFFKENPEMLTKAEKVINRKDDIAFAILLFLECNKFKKRFQYKKIEKHIDDVMSDAFAFRINVKYISSAGNNLASKEIPVYHQDIARFKEDPSLLMGKAEYNKFIKEQQKEALEKKQHEYYERVNNIIDYANEHRDSLVIKDVYKRQVGDPRPGHGDAPPVHGGRPGPVRRRGRALHLRPLPRRRKVLRTHAGNASGAPGAAGIASGYHPCLLYTSRWV